jgi:hypothetical protein
LRKNDASRGGEMSLSQVFEKVLKKVPDLAQEILGGYVEEALIDSRAFLEGVEKKLIEFRDQYQREEITLEEFKWLVRGLLNLVKAQALSEAGVAQVRITHFWIGLLELVIKAMISILV